MLGNEKEKDCTAMPSAEVRETSAIEALWESTQPIANSQEQSAVGQTLPALPDGNMKTGIDDRESLYNDRAVGAIHQIQIPAERITTLHGIMLDLDPKILTPGNTIFSPAESPGAFYTAIKPVLDRHVLVRHAEIRVSGTGLHAIIWLSPAVELCTAGEQQRWGHMVKAIQRSLPSDPDMPGITAVTRPIGSKNGKNGAIVRSLAPGKPVTRADVEEYVTRLVAAPFNVIAMPLLGEQRISPCPVCRGAGTRLDILDFVGVCYGACGKITLAHLLDEIYLARPTASEATRNNKDIANTVSGSPLVTDRDAV
jgi:hypothetical protein